MQGEGPTDRGTPRQREAGGKQKGYEMEKERRQRQEEARNRKRWRGRVRERRQATETVRETG